LRESFHAIAILGKFAPRMENQDLQNTAGLLLKNWGMVPPDQLDWETLKQALRMQMRAMLADEFERLVQAMYRLDVAEPKFQAALALPTLDARADALAIIVLDRELQRLETWRKYSQG
jgi:hypothetical protein